MYGCYLWFYALAMGRGTCQLPLSASCRVLIVHLAMLPSQGPLAHTSLTLAVSAGHCYGHTSLIHCRGIGGSTIFKHFWEYSTGALAADALALLEHLGWERTHLIGMSLGGAESHGEEDTARITNKAPLHVKFGSLFAVTRGDDARRAAHVAVVEQTLPREVNWPAIGRFPPIASTPEM